MTTHTTPIDLRPYHGRECEAVLNNAGELPCKGKISVNKNGAVFVCQNTINCTQAENKLGFKYSWQVQRSDQKVFWDENLISITLLDEPKPINPEWDWKDGEEVYLRGNKYKCHMLKDDLVCFVSAATGVCRKLFTLKAAYNHGFRKLPPQPQRKLVEITEEMFDKTNLIGRKVENSGGEEIVIKAISNEDGKRFVSPNKVQWFSISFCKLIEE